MVLSALRPRPIAESPAIGHSLSFVPCWCLQCLIMIVRIAGGCHEIPVGWFERSRLSLSHNVDHDSLYMWHVVWHAVQHTVAYWKWLHSTSFSRNPSHILWDFTSSPCRSFTFCARRSEVAAPWVWSQPVFGCPKNYITCNYAAILPKSFSLSCTSCMNLQIGITSWRSCKSAPNRVFPFLVQLKHHLVPRVTSSSNLPFLAEER